MKNPIMKSLLPPGITLRPAARADDRAIRARIRAERLNPLGLDWRNFLVAEDPARRIVAIGAVKAHGDGSRELASIAVAPDRRGEGIADAVIRALLEREGKTPGPVYLTCRRKMADFYMRFGFQPIGIGDMPPYFRRLYMLFYFVSRLLGQNNRLEVMRGNDEKNI
jgi:N-acetylglutamate synthase-like GNAT family acetyltransferase